MFPGMMPGMMIMQPGARPMFPVNMQGGPMNMYPRPMYQQMGNGQQPRGGPRGPAQQQQRVKYTANARNMTQAGNSNAPRPPAAQAAPPQQPPLTAADLAGVPEDRRKNMIGERIYPLIHKLQP